MNKIHTTIQRITRELQRRPRLVLRTADAYADRINSKKNNSMKGLNMVIYGNKL